MIAPKTPTGYRLYCDICGYCEEAEFGNFHDAVDYKKEKGVM